MGCHNSKDMLKEPLFVESTKARIPCNVIEEVRGSASSYSRQYYSPRIYKIMEHMKGKFLSKVDSAIEASKDHWTELEPEYSSATNLSANPHNMGNMAKCILEDSTSVLDLKSVSGREGEATNIVLELHEENVAFIKNLQRKDPVGGFFKIDIVDGEWVLGRKIGEGGQATIYEVNEYIKFNGERTRYTKPCVLKVFKMGYSIFDLRKQWPLTLLHKLNPSYENFQERPAYCNPIYHGRLLRDGRFAFEMKREWGDLRKLLDVRMQYNGNQRPPLMMPNGNYLESCMFSMMFQIAWGMKGMHKEGILHRDLKASNVLIKVLAKMKNPLDDREFESILKKDHFSCEIADFECSIGVVGTGYWRAPEILKVVKNRTLFTMSDIFTPKSDVYSYAMLCYEIITGFIPFEDIEDEETSCGDVIEGKRPKLPEHLKPWINDLICKCWHMDPFQRPTFEEIVHILLESKNNQRLK